MIDLDQYKRLKDKADRAKQDHDRAAGACDQLMSTLKQEYDCDDLEEAERLKKKLTTEMKAAEAEYDEKLAAWEAQWGTRV